MPDEIPLNESLFGPQPGGGGMPQQPLPPPRPAPPAFVPQAALPPQFVLPRPPRPPAPRQFAPLPVPPPAQTPHHSLWRTALGLLSIVLLVAAIGVALAYAGILPLHAISGLQPTPSTSSIVPAHATLAVHDPLQNNSKGYQWLGNRNLYGTCAFEQGGYDVAVHGNAGVLFHACLMQNHKIDFRNFVYQVTMTLQSGDCGGIVFRSHDPHLYYFDVCSNGTYNVVAYISDSHSTKHLASATTTILPIGQSTQLAVVANGSTLTFYMNGQRVTMLHDTTYTDGQIGVLVANTRMGVSTTTNAVFKDAQVWTF